jgi:flagellar motor switch protein FliG
LPREQAIAAILRALPADLADRVLARLHEPVADRLRARLKMADGVPGRIDDALKEIADVQRIAERPPPLAPGDDAVRALKAVSADRLLLALAGEQPSTITLVLSCLDQAAAGDLLKRLPADVRPEVALRLGRPAPPNKALVDRLARAILTKCRATTEVAPEPTPDDRARRVAGLFRALARPERVAALKRLGADDADTAAKVNEHLYQFDDLLKVEDRPLQMILAETDLKTVALALQGAGQAITAKVFANLSSRARESVAEESSLLGNPAKPKIEEARASILAIIRKFDEEERISLDG